MILVTGATGHTGSRIVKALVSEGRQVRCLVRTPHNQRYIPDSENVEIAQGDFRHPETIRSALDRVSIVINAAHIRFSETLISLCKQAGVRRVLFMSSTRRYTRFPCVSAKQVIKGEEAIRNSGLDYTIVRPSMIYGGPRDNNISRLADQIRKHTLFPLFGNGKNLVQPVFVLDLVQAIMFCVNHPETAGKEYTLAGLQPLSYRTLVHTIAKAMNRKIICIPLPLNLCILLVKMYEKFSKRPRITAEQVRRFGEDKAFDISLAKKEIAFSPRSFAQGIQMKIAGEV